MEWELRTGMKQSGVPRNAAASPAASVTSGFDAAGVTSDFYGVGATGGFDALGDEEKDVSSGASAFAPWTRWGLRPSSGHPWNSITRQQCAPALAAAVAVAEGADV